MRILTSILIAFFVSTVTFFMTKLWGQSYQYIDYKHSFYENVQTPVEFKAAKDVSGLTTLIQSTDPLWINLAITADQKLIVHFSNTEPTMYRNQTWAQLSQDQAAGKLILFAEVAEQLKKHKLVLNLTENPMSGPDIILHEMNQLGFSKMENFIFTGPYEAALKEIKNKMPAWLFGTTSPEILKIKAMESLFLIEAAIYRADFVIHPLKYYKKEFFTPTLLADTQRRFKRIIIGPLSNDEIESAKKLNPFGIVTVQ